MFDVCWNKKNNNHNKNRLKNIKNWLKVSLSLQALKLSAKSLQELINTDYITRYIVFIYIDAFFSQVNLRDKMVQKVFLLIFIISLQDEFLNVMRFWIKYSSNPVACFKPPSPSPMQKQDPGSSFKISVNSILVQHSIAVLLTFSSRKKLSF